MSSFKDHFSRGSAEYAAYRPRYPDVLFDYVARLPARRRLAWDCATGSGQAAVPLAGRFERVIATDASAEQLAHAERHPRVTYAQALADGSGIPSGTVDLVTVAQALHWLPIDAFFAEVRRVLAPEGALAVWCYNRLSIEPSIDAVIEHYYAVTCGPYWPPERRLVDEGYASIELPFNEVDTAAMSIEAMLSLDDLAGYLRTWSATRRLAAATGRDPVTAVVERLQPIWGGRTHARRVRWPLHVRAAVKAAG